MDERRQHPRYSVAITVDVKDEDALHVRAGTMTNVSIGGAFLENVAAPPGTRVWVLVMQPDADPCSLPATVRHAAPAGVGVQWASLGREERDAVWELVKRAR